MKLPLETTVENLALRRLHSVNHGRNRSLDIFQLVEHQLLVDEFRNLSRLLVVVQIRIRIGPAKPLLTLVRKLLVEGDVEPSRVGIVNDERLLVRRDLLEVLGRFRLVRGPQTLVVLNFVIFRVWVLR